MLMNLRLRHTKQLLAHITQLVMRLPINTVIADMMFFTVFVCTLLHPELHNMHM